MRLFQNTAASTYGHSIHEVRLAHPNISIPETIDAIGDFVAYESTPRPQIDWNENVSEGPPVDGKQVWVVTTAPVEQLNARIAQKSMEVRSDREPLLTSCDWTQLPDAPLTAEQVEAWKQYRTELRNVTDQPGFPWIIIWPTRPE